MPLFCRKKADECTSTCDFCFTITTQRNKTTTNTSSEGHSNNPLQWSCETAHHFLIIAREVDMIIDALIWKDFQRQRGGITLFNIFGVFFCVIASFWNVSHSNLNISEREVVVVVPLSKQVGFKRSVDHIVGPAFQYVKQILSLEHNKEKQQEQVNQASDVVDLYYCDFQNINWTAFMYWAEPALEEALQSTSSLLNVSTIAKEWSLELLEIYGQHFEYCDFSKWHPNLPNTTEIFSAGKQLQQVASTNTVPSEHARVLFCIIAYKDSKHLQRLIESIHMSHHLIVIQLDRYVDVEFSNEAKRIAGVYENVVVVQFGTIVYLTGTISRLNIQLMHWAHQTLELRYDYHIVIDGAAYPLLEKEEMAQYLYRSNHSVWLGHAAGHTAGGIDLLSRKTLVTTTSANNNTIHFLSDSAFQNHTFVFPDWIQDAMEGQKTNSGNTAAYSYSVIRQMITDPRIMQLHCLGKYAGEEYRYVEEYTWASTMNLLGLANQAQHNIATSQFWQYDKDTWWVSISNAILTNIGDQYYFSGDLNLTDGNHAFNGPIALMTYLTKAKNERNALFARKFSSTVRQSVKLLNQIEEEIWRSESKPRRRRRRKKNRKKQEDTH